MHYYSSGEWLFGRGVGTTPSGYFMGYTRIIYRIGIVGFISYLLVIIIVMIKGNNISKVIGVLYIILLFGAEFDIFRYVIVYITLVYAGVRQKELERKAEK